jgi:hypothetical protein
MAEPFALTGCGFTSISPLPVVRIQTTQEVSVFRHVALLLVLAAAAAAQVAPTAALSASLPDPPPLPFPART